MLNNISSGLDKVASSLEEKGLVREAEQLDIIANTLDKSAGLGFDGKGSWKGDARPGDDVFYTKDDPKTGLNKGDALQVQLVNSDKTYEVKRRPFRDNPKPFTVSFEDVDYKNPKPWYSKK